jgi:flagellar protein FlbT
LLLIEGELPVVRERDYLPAEKATSTARQLYLVLQRAYLQDDFDSYRDEYFRLVGMHLSAQPTASPYIMEVNSMLGEKRLYAALRASRKVVQFDEGLLTSGEESARWEGF